MVWICKNAVYSKGAEGVNDEGSLKSSTSVWEIEIIVAGNLGAEGTSGLGYKVKAIRNSRGHQLANRREKKIFAD